MTPEEAGLLSGIAARIWNRALADDFRGPDPYDGLRSRLLFPLVRRSRPLRLALIQSVMRCPFDPRRILLIAPGLNPKALALFLSGIADMPSLPGAGRASEWIEDALLSLSSAPDGTPALSSGRLHREGLGAATALSGERTGLPMGWGYDFPWQGMAFLLPPYFPTSVTTSFVVDALRRAGSPSSAAVTAAAASFVTGSLERSGSEDGICFSYSAGDATRVYNSSLLAARILAQAWVDGGDPALRDLALSACGFVVSKQADDGSWVYGEAPYWNWIDNFHTGYVLECLEGISMLLGVDEWDRAIARGLEYYENRLFLHDGTARYYSDSTLPLDPHAFAQGALTLLALERHDPAAAGTASRVLLRAVDRLWDARRGGFVHRRHRFHSKRTIHVRWSQAWMFRAICALMRRTGQPD